MSTRPIRVNFIVNLISPMTRIVVALVTVPLYLHHIGDARYGVMSIVWVLLGLFGFLDLGLSRAVTNALAKLRDAPQAHRARVLLTTFGLNVGIRRVWWRRPLCIRRTFAQTFHIDAGRDQSRGVRSLPWIACLLPLTLHFGGWRGCSGEPRTLPACEFDPDFHNDSCSSCANRRGYFRQSLAYVVIPTAVVAQGLGAIVILAVVYRLEGPFSLRAIDWEKRGNCSAMAAGCSATQVVSIPPSPPPINLSLGRWWGSRRSLTTGCR